MESANRNNSKVLSALPSCDLTISSRRGSSKHFRQMAVLEVMLHWSACVGERGQRDGTGKKDR